MNMQNWKELNFIQTCKLCFVRVYSFLCSCMYICGLVQFFVLIFTFSFDGPLAPYHTE